VFILNKQFLNYDCLILKSDKTICTKPDKTFCTKPANYITVRKKRTKSKVVNVEHIQIPGKSCARHKHLEITASTT